MELFGKESPGQDRIIFRLWWKIMLKQDLWKTTDRQADRQTDRLVDRQNSRRCYFRVYTQGVLTKGSVMWFVIGCGLWDELWLVATERGKRDVILIFLWDFVTLDFLFLITDDAFIRYLMVICFCYNLRRGDYTLFIL